ncbi:MAG TPA: aminoacetone oxidase family FAD-binding enzyme [Candidatus Eisenbacteria bacterium]|nr:aminoacetone oxidase family FAD-binding enzyme [Candidatus Eisenbacteria bacterium]
MQDRADIAVVGSGAAGLMAAIQAGRRARSEGASLRIVALDGAKKLGAKILISGGGRCNVTHHAVLASDFAGSTAPAIRKVLARFDVSETVRFFEALGVRLKREETGKLFPTTDRAQSVLDALLRAVDLAGVHLAHPWRVDRIERRPDGFLLVRDDASASTIHARRVILATGGMSVPKTGSDGHGYDIARSLDHSVTPKLVPGLVPLLLPEGYWPRSLSGVAFPVRVELRSGSGRALVSFTGPMLCAHFGVTGPAIMDISRHYLLARCDDANARLSVSLLPEWSAPGLDGAFQRLGPETPLAFLRQLLPERVVRALGESLHVSLAESGGQLTRASRSKLVRSLLELPLPVVGDRGFKVAEVTAGGVPLSELHLNTLESRRTPALYICGEICDVDGRIGGFNFQWAWASGYVAGTSAAAALTL